MATKVAGLISKQWVVCSPYFSLFSCFSLPRFPRAGFLDVFPRFDELKRKNRDCSQSKSILKEEQRLAVKEMLFGSSGLAEMFFLYFQLAIRQAFSAFSQDRHLRRLGF